MSAATTITRYIPRYRPERLEPAYDRFEEVEELVRAGGPYPAMFGATGYAAFNMPTTPWFRATWAADGQLRHPDAETVFTNQRFIDATRRVFDAQIVRPWDLVVNVMGPMPMLPAHTDTPTFRGLARTDTSPWLLMIMGSSGLFDNWAVRIAGAISWCYRGTGAGFQYWPDGPSAAALEESGPFGNVAIVADNDYMFHRVAEVGDRERDAVVERYSNQAEIAFRDHSWMVIEQGEERVRYGPDEVRVSLLWRAITLEDEAARVRFDEHTDDLDIDRVVDVLLADLNEHGVDIERPKDPLNDPAWTEVLNREYGFNPEFAPK
jgi:hypothetical protein